MSRELFWVVGFECADEELDDLLIRLPFYHRTWFGICGDSSDPTKVAPHRIHFKATKAKAKTYETTLPKLLDRSVTITRES